MTKLIKLAAVAALVLSVAAANAADKIDNPLYKSWAKYKPDTSVTTKTSIEAGPTTIETITTTKLLEVKDDKVVVEVSVTSKIMGMETKQPATKQDIPKQVDVGSVPPGLGADKTAKVDGQSDTGKKKVKVGGTEYECQWVKVKNGDTEGETFTSEDVPGMVVKMVSKAKTGGMTLEATDITLKK
jgi:hypothetical protein